MAGPFGDGRPAVRRLCHRRPLRTGSPRGWPRWSIQRRHRHPALAPTCTVRHGSLRVLHHARRGAGQGRDRQRHGRLRRRPLRQVHDGAKQPASRPHGLEGRPAQPHQYPRAVHAPDAGDRPLGVAQVLLWQRRQGCAERHGQKGREAGGHERQIIWCHFRVDATTLCAGRHTLPWHARLERGTSDHLRLPGTVVGGHWRRRCRQSPPNDRPRQDQHGPARRRLRVLRHRRRLEDHHSGFTLRDGHHRRHADPDPGCAGGG